MSKKNYISAQGRVVSIPSKRIFGCVTSSGTFYLDCHSPSVIYIITCSKFSLQYVGRQITRKMSNLIGISHVSETLISMAFVIY